MWSSAADVAVVIPCHDAGGYVIEAVDSAISQGCGQVIIVDDASSDPTTTDALARIVGRSDPAVELVHLARNVGQLHAIAAGIERVERPITIALDADDRLAPGWPARAVRILASRPDVVQLSGRPRTVDAGGDPIVGRAGRLSLLPTIQPRLDSGDVTSRLLNHNWYEVATTSGLVYPTAILRRLCEHLPAERGWFDTWATATAPFLGTVLGVDEVAFDYRIHGDNVLGGTGDLDLFVSTRLRRAAFVDEWAARTGHDGRVDLRRDGRLIVDRFGAGERVGRGERLSAVGLAIGEARHQPPAPAVAMVLDRALRAASRTLAGRIAADGLGRTAVDLVPGLRSFAGT